MGLSAMVIWMLAISVGVAVGGISVGAGVDSTAGVLVNAGEDSSVAVESTCDEELQAVKIIVMSKAIRYVFFMCYILTGFSY
jgi:hypothetical protein